MSGKVRVYIACSLDGFIAGPDNDLSWLPGADGEPVEEAEAAPEALAYEDFIAEVGALLMGRGTYDAVAAFEGPWPYGELPVLVRTHRSLTPKVPQVRAVEGEIDAVVDEARRVAGAGDVYLDGGALIRDALDADLIDELVVTLVPVVLGAGHPLFAGVEQRRRFTLEGHHSFTGGLVQLHLRPKR